ncbi:hypothetical protein L1049_008657 [Liquidambar formosana]|uniref:Uncharacterized protein n=1 Tax=Liquidambar formosana TaxID=63359 RepID=A0AAP0S4M0_LIQFO
MGDLLTDQEKHKAQIRKLKKELASKKAAFSVLKDDYETTMATIKTISVELEEARTAVQKVNAKLMEARKETEGLKLGQKRWEDRFHKEVRTRERLISEVEEEKVREEVTREMALEVKEYEDKVYLQGWNTLLEKIRAKFPSVDLRLISFERTEVPDEDYEALEKVPELTSTGPKTTIEDMPPEA